MGKRPRIKRVADDNGSTESKVAIGVGNGLVEDPLEFKANKASKNARLDESINYRITLDLWHEKHYLRRHQFGDESGSRQGIEPGAVKQLVSWAMKHLLYYSATVKEFNFLNHNNPNGRGEFNKILLRDSYSSDIELNVPIEVHFLDFNRYEITVITAMRVVDFKIFDGQFVLELRGEDDSLLTKMVKHKLQPLGECTT